jgi:rubrerythrin
VGVGVGAWSRYEGGVGVWVCKVCACVHARKRPATNCKFRTCSCISSLQCFGL